MGIYESLQRIFEKLDLSWIDSVVNIDNSDEFANLLLMFPNLKRIFQEENGKKECLGILRSLLGK